MGKKFKTLEERSESEIRAEIDSEFARWDAIMQNGCQDPFWPDGTNMNLIRNHIIYYRGLLEERSRGGRQLSLFGEPEPVKGERPLPPEVSENFMSPTGKYVYSNGRRIEREAG